MWEPAIAIAASAREWPRRLYRHAAEHGGVRIRAMVLDRAQALGEGYDVLVADDVTSFLDAALSARLHDRDRRVLGVYAEPWGRIALWRAGADLVIERGAAAEQFLAAVGALAGRDRPRGQHPQDGGSAPAASAML